MIYYKNAVTGFFCSRGLRFSDILKTETFMDISQTIHLLGDLLGAVISELESPEIFDTEESIRAHAKARRAGESGADEKLREEVM